MYFCNFLTWLIIVFSIIIVVVENTNWFLWFCQLYPKVERMQATIVIPFSHILIKKMTKYLSVFSQHIVAFLKDALPIQNINILNFVKDFSNICVIKMILTSSTDLYITTTDNSASYQRDIFVIKQSDKDYWFIEFYSNSIFNQGLHLQEMEHCQIGLDMESK